MPLLDAYADVLADDYESLGEEIAALQRRRDLARDGLLGRMGAAMHAALPSGTVVVRPARTPGVPAGAGIRVRRPRGKPGTQPGTQAAAVGKEDSP